MCPKIHYTFDVPITSTQFIVSMQPVYGSIPPRVTGQFACNKQLRCTVKTTETVFSYQPPGVTRARCSATSKHEFRSVTNARRARSRAHTYVRTETHTCPPGGTNGYICTRRTRGHACMHMHPPPHTGRDCEQYAWESRC